MVKCRARDTDSDDDDDDDFSVFRRVNRARQSHLHLPPGQVQEQVPVALPKEPVDVPKETQVQPDEVKRDATR